MMSDAADSRLQWGNGVDITPPRLYRVEFVSEPSHDSEEAAEGTIEFKMSLLRMSLLRVGVEFGVSVSNVGGLSALALFRMECSLIEGSPEATDPETAFRQACARLAPTVMYPYVREALGSLAMKAQIPNFVLPIVNFGDVYDVSEIDVPAARE